MSEFEHLSKEKLEHVEEGLWQVESALNGLGAIFRSGRNELPLDEDEWFGIGQIFKIFSHRISVLNDILQYGDDSMAITKKSTEDKFERKKSELIEKMKDSLEDNGDEK